MYEIAADCAGGGGTTVIDANYTACETGIAVRKVVHRVATQRLCRSRSICQYNTCNRSCIGD